MTRHVIWALLLVLSACGGHPSDRSLIATLQGHRSEFETLKQMTDRDDIRGRIDPEHSSWNPAPKSGREQYERLFRQLGLESLDRDSKGAVWFYASCIGLVTSSSCKGVVYSNEPLTPTFTSLDAGIADPKLRETDVVFRSIEEHWYVFLLH
jgi:hypothetical protein